MKTIVVNYKVLCPVLSLTLTVIVLQIYVLNDYVMRNSNIKDSDLYNYVNKSPDVTIAEETITALWKDVERHRSSAANSSSFESFLFSFYPIPRFNRSSLFLAPEKTFSNESLLVERLIQLQTLLKDKRQVCSKAAVIGGWSCGKRVDGAKPICLSLNPNKNCLVYSFGVGHDFSFETKMANYGCQVFTFDDDDTHSYDNAVFKNLYFFKVRLGSSLQILDVVNKVTKKNYRYLYRPLDNIMYILQHENLSIDLLKIDIEGGEWEVLNESLCKIGILNRTRQLVLETHLDVLVNFTLANEEYLLSNISYYNKALQCLVDHKFALSMSIPNEIRPTFSVIEGLSFVVNEEQLWVNMNFDTEGSEVIKENRFFNSQNLEYISWTMEKRTL